jgi:hypothetical protein
MPIVGNPCPPLASDRVHGSRSAEVVARVKNTPRKRLVDDAIGPRQQGKPVNSDMRRELRRKASHDAANREVVSPPVRQSHRDPLAPSSARGTVGIKRFADRLALPPSAVSKFRLEPSVRTDAVGYRLTRFGWCAMVAVMDEQASTEAAGAALERARAADYRRNGWVHGDRGVPSEPMALWHTDEQEVRGQRTAPTCEACGLQHGGECDW